MGEVLEDGRGRSGLDDTAAVHHEQSVDRACHHAEVVADQQQRHAARLDQVADQVEDLALDRDVERGRRFVGDQQVGAAGQRHRNDDALALAARELVRMGVETLRRRRQPDLVEQAQRFRARGIGRQALVQAQWFGDLAADRVQRVQGGHRLLEHHADPASAQAAHRGVVETEQLGVVEAHRTAGARCVGQQPHQREGVHRLAAAGLADQADRLAAFERERHAAQRIGRAARRRQGDAQVVDFEQGHGAESSAGISPATITAIAVTLRLGVQPAARSR